MTAAANAADKIRREEEEALARVVRADLGLNAMTPTELSNHLSRVLDTREAADVLGLGVVTVAKLRCRGGEGPAFLKCGGAVRYQLKDLLLWREQQRRYSTSEYPTTPGPGRPRKHV